MTVKELREWLSDKGSNREVYYWPSRKPMEFSDIGLQYSDDGNSSESSEPTLFDDAIDGR